MKKHTVIALLVMCLSACAAEKAPIKESNPQTDTTSQIKQPKATANPYQDVFTGVAPILGVQASEVKPDVVYNYNYDSTQADEEDEHIPAFTLENPITRLSNEEENALEEKVLTVMEGLGWKNDGGADGEGHAVHFAKDTHRCWLLFSLNEEASDITRDELVEIEQRDDIDNLEDLDLDLVTRIGMTCFNEGKHS